MKPKKESPPSGGLVSKEFAGSSNRKILNRFEEKIQCISCGMFFPRKRHSDQFCSNCEQEGGLV